VLLITTRRAAVSVYNGDESGDRFASQTTPYNPMGTIANLFKAQLEELKRRDDELNRDIQDTLKRCDVLLQKLSKLDDE
jgi:hypothetical protein